VQDLAAFTLKLLVGPRRVRFPKAYDGTMDLKESIHVVAVYGILECLPVTVCSCV